MLVLTQEITTLDCTYPVGAILEMGERKEKNWEAAGYGKYYTADELKQLEKVAEVIAPEVKAPEVKETKVSKIEEATPKIPS